MREIFKLLFTLLLGFIKNIGWTVFAGLFIFIVFELCKFAFGYSTEFHIVRAFFILGSLSLTLFAVSKLSVWLSKDKGKIELKEWR